MLVPYSYQLSLAASDKLASAPQSELGAKSTAGAVQRTPVPRSPSPHKEWEQAPPQALQSPLSSPDEAVAGPSHASNPLENIKEHQALLKRVAENLNLPIKEVVEEADDLFSVISATTSSQVALLVHPLLFL